MFAEKQLTRFFVVTPKKGLCGRKSVGKSHNIFSGKFGQKSFALLKFCLLLHLRKGAYSEVKICLYFVWYVRL